MQSTFLQTSRLSATRGVCTLEMRGVRAPRMPSAWFAGVVTGCPRPAGFRAFAAATGTTLPSRSDCCECGPG